MSEQTEKKAAVKPAAVKKPAADGSNVIAVKKTAEKSVSVPKVKKTKEQGIDGTAVKTLRVTLKKSLIGRAKSHRACVNGLGLRRLQQTREVAATKENMGMINKVKYLLKVE